MRKADLSLSMNAIVILILAITLLGLGLSFMRGLFKQMEERVSTVVGAQELANPPTRDNVLTTAPGDITLRKGEIGEIIIAYLNTYAGEDTCSLNITNSAGTNVANLEWSRAVVNMQPDQINKWTVGVAYNTGTLPATGLYTTTMTCTASDPDSKHTKDIIITFNP